MGVGASGSHTTTRSSIPVTVVECERTRRPSNTVRSETTRNTTVCRVARSATTGARAVGGGTGDDDDGPNAGEPARHGATPGALRIIGDDSEDSGSAPRAPILGDMKRGTSRARCDDVQRLGSRSGENRWYASSSFTLSSENLSVHSGSSIEEGGATEAEAVAEPEEVDTSPPLVAAVEGAWSGARGS
jgi:hypothetical protein